MLADADFVLGVGAELGYYTTEGGLLFPQAEVARIDIKPMPEAIGVIPGLYVQGDGRKSVAAINEALEARQVRKEAYIRSVVVGSDTLLIGDRQQLSAEDLAAHPETPWIRNAVLPKLMVRPIRTTRASASTSDAVTARMKCVV